MRIYSITIMFCSFKYGICLFLRSVGEGGAKKDMDGATEASSPEKYS